MNYSGGQPGHVVPRSAPGFDALYAGTPAWEIGRPQPAFLRLAASAAIRGRVLDAGCGTGEHALMAAALGLDVTGIDSAPLAIERANRKATERGLSARFLVWDAFELTTLGDTFDTVLDCGLFHLFEDEQRRRYVEALRAVVSPGGHVFMLCFSDRHRSTVGPRRVSEAEIRTCFDSGWQIASIEPAALVTTWWADGVPAWLASIQRD